MHTELMHALSDKHEEQIDKQTHKRVKYTIVYNTKLTDIYIPPTLVDHGWRRRKCEVYSVPRGDVLN